MVTKPVSVIKPLEENFAPYAPFKSVIDVIKRYRERGLPEPITLEVLEQVGISPTMAGLTLRTLVFLGLMDEGGNRTESFDRLRRASTEEYPQVLAEIIRKAYLPVFTIVDPAQDSDIAIGDAFRRYDPATQRQKMVRLFIGLCQEAQIIKREGKRIRISSPRKPRLPKETQKDESKQQEIRQEECIVQSKTDGQTQVDTGSDYRLISAVIQHLPKSGCWTGKERERWINAMTAAVDLIVKIQGSDVPKEI